MRNSFCFYPHPSSLNHGCEAIAVSTRAILKKYSLDVQTTLLTKYECSCEKAGGSLAYDLYDTVKYCPMPSLRKWSFRWFLYQFGKILQKDFSVMLLSRKFSKNNQSIINGNDVFVSIGGDNYCYGRPIAFYAVNKSIHDANKKSIFWGCSIEPGVITQEMVNDLSRYNTIVTRESITYNALLNKGLNNVCLYPDPAFTLEPSNEIHEILNNTIGINLSPMILEYSQDSTTVFNAYKELVSYILINTNCNIALIPHVTAQSTDDRRVLETLNKEFEGNDRIRIYNEMNCKEIKAIIAQCRLFIGARTHATIASYSMCVPTLVCGYSVKAKGIAKDLFGTYENYVIEVQSIKDENVLVDAFKWLLKHEEEIRSHLTEIMPQYIGWAWEAGGVLADVLR